MKKEKYSTDFINNASRLDALLTNDGLFTKYSLKIVEDNDESAVREICNRLSSLVDEKISMQIRQVALVYKDDLIKFLGYNAVLSICQDHESGEETSPVSFDELLTQLDALIGLDEVKKTVSSLIAYHRIQKDRESIGLSSPKGTMHMAFLGNPGTGKTTVARIVGRLYRHLGLLSKGHFIEVSRTDLIAGYQGQTALKVK